MTSQQYAMIRALEKLFVVIALMFLMNGLLPFYTSWRIRSGELADTGQGNLTFQMISLSIYSIGLLFLVTDYRRAAKLVMGNPLAFALLVYVLFSSFWSPLPGTTFRRGFALLLTTTFAMYLVLRFTPQDMLRLLAWALAIACAMSLFHGLFTWWGAHRVGPHTGLWRGTFGHKNQLGLWAAMTVLVMLLHLTSGPQDRLRPLWGGTLLVAIFLLAKAQSATSIATVAGIIAVWPMVRFLRKGRMPLNIKLPVILILGFGVLLVLGVQVLAIGLEALGKDATLTGRTGLWIVAIHEGMKNFWIGAGYRSFWTVAGATNVWAQMNWEGMGNGHNGYLDVWLELGTAGLGMFLALVVTAGLRVWRRLIGTRDAAGIFYALFLAFLVVYSLPEVVIMEQSNLMWVLFLMTLFWLTPQRVAVARRAVVPTTAPAFGGSPPIRRG